MSGVAGVSYSLQRPVFVVDARAGAVRVISKTESSITDVIPSPTLSPSALVAQTASPTQSTTTTTTSQPSTGTASSPTNAPSPVRVTTADPTSSDTKIPTSSPTYYPTIDPTAYPTVDPTARAPSLSPSNNAGAGGGAAGSPKSSSPSSSPTRAPRSAAPSMLPTTASPVVRSFRTEDASEYNTGLGGMSIGFEDVLVAALSGIVVALLGILVAMYRGAFRSDSYRDDMDLLSMHSSTSKFSKPRKPRRIRVQQPEERPASPPARRDDGSDSSDEDDNMNNKNKNRKDGERKAAESRIRNQSQAPNEQEVPPVAATVAAPSPDIEVRTIKRIPSRQPKRVADTSAEAWAAFEEEDQLNRSNHSQESDAPIIPVRADEDIFSPLFNSMAFPESKPISRITEIMNSPPTAAQEPSSSTLLSSATSPPSLSSASPFFTPFALFSSPIRSEISSLFSSPSVSAPQPTAEQPLAQHPSAENMAEHVVMPAATSDSVELPSQSSTASDATSAMSVAAAKPAITITTNPPTSVDFAVLTSLAMSRAPFRFPVVEGTADFDVRAGPTDEDEEGVI